MVEQRKFVSQIYLETFRSVTLSVGIIFRNPGDQTICWEFIHCAAQILVSDSDTWLCVESFFVRHISRLSGIIFRNPGNQTIYWEFIYCAAQILVSDSDTWWCVESFFVRSISRLSDEWALDQQCADPHFLSFFFFGSLATQHIGRSCKILAKNFYARQTLYCTIHSLMFSIIFQGSWEIFRFFSVVFSG